MILSTNRTIGLPIKLVDDVRVNDKRVRSDYIATKPQLTALARQ